MIRIARNPDGTPDDIVITDPIAVHIEDMGGGWWLRVDTASGEALVIDLWPVVTLPKRLPPWAKVPAAKLLKWIKGRVRISAMAEVETVSALPRRTDSAPPMSGALGGSRPVVNGGTVGTEYGWRR